MALTENEAREAQDYNRRRCGPLGWRSSYGRIANHLALNTTTATGPAFARAVAAYQVAQVPRLTEDGKLGPTTWAKLKVAMNRAGTRPIATTIPPWLGGGSGEPSVRVNPGPSPWFDYARAEKTVWDEMIASWAGDARKDPANAEAETDLDERYFRASPYFGGSVQAMGSMPSRADRHWCAAFVNYCLHRAGYSHTGSAGAHSFLTRNWQFDALREPRQGCIIVVGDSTARGGRGKGAHVAFLDTWSNLPHDPGGHVENRWNRSFNLLGGNQSQRVWSRREPVRTDNSRDMLAARGYNGVTSPYLWPRVGPPVCTIDAIIDTDQPHHCGKVPVAEA